MNSTKDGITDKLKKLRKKAKKYISEHIPITKDDWKYYEQIAELIPEIRMYKKQTIYYVKKQGLSRRCLSLRSYHRYLIRHPEEQALLRRSLTLTGSHFFRGNDWDDFQRISEQVLHDRERVKIWCAGCANGKEVYSLIMAYLNFKDISQLDILASDYKDELLAVCKEGVYGTSMLKEIPEAYYQYLDIGEKIVFHKELRDCIHTQNINLLTDSYPAGFDVILCRNVIKFFSPDMREKVKKDLSASLAPGGVLFVSDDENAKGVELIGEPEKLGLRTTDNRCIYVKDAG